jgi:DNA-binding SARP family transcriptional activator
MSQPTKGCVSRGVDCHRSHYALASHLPEGVCQQLAYRVVSHYEAGDLEQAETLAHFLMQAVVERKEAHWSVYAQLLLTMVLHAKDHAQEALERHLEIMRMIDGNKVRDAYHEEYLDALWERALCLYDVGDRAEFSRAVKLFTSLHSENCKCYFQIRSRLLQGLGALMQGHALQALMHFQSVAPYRLVSSFHYVASILMSAECAARQEETDTALECIEKANTLMASGYWGALHAWRERIPATIALANQHSLNWPVVPTPIAFLGQTVQIPHPQAVIEIRAFGEGRLHVYQSPLNWGKSANNRLLLTFLAMHPQGVTAQQLKTHLWPDVPSYDPLYTAITNLRSFLGKQGGHLENRQGRYRLVSTTWLDVIEYERLYVAAQQTTDHSERFRLYKTATALYTGDFLEGITDNLWASEQAARLRNLQAWLLWTLGAIFYDDKQYAQAKAMLYNALEINPIFDPAIEQLMRLYDATGERMEGAALYARYERRVATEHEIKPSPRLQRLYQRWQNHPEITVTGPFANRDVLGPTRQPVLYVGQSAPSPEDEDE